MLRSPDPAVRDRQAYSTLATWIGRGVLGKDELRALGAEISPKPWARGWPRGAAWIAELISPRNARELAN